MKEVILTVGQQGSGKSCFCEKAVAFDPRIIWVSRDKILMELFGKVFLSSYSDGHFQAMDVMWERVAAQINAASRFGSEFRLILDTWNGTPEERLKIIKKLHELGVERIVAWYFITPVQVVNEWFWQKSGVGKLSEMRRRSGEGLTFFPDNAPVHDHDSFHGHTSRIDSEPFDVVIRINPVITSPKLVLNYTPV